MDIHDRIIAIVLAVGFILLVINEAISLHEMVVYGYAAFAFIGLILSMLFGAFGGKT